MRQPGDDELRARTLDDILKRGITPYITRAADELDRLSQTLDTQPLVPISVLTQRCPDLTGVLLAYEFAAAAACLFNPLLCAIILGAYYGLRLALWLIGC